MRRLAALAAVCALAAACGGGRAEGGGEPAGLTVFAASSLTDVFRELAPDARFSFAGSDELATQIREGAPADVYAAASPRYPEELHADRLVEAPAVFATNRLVVVVPSDNPAGVQSLDDLRRAGLRLVVGGEGVPIGDYTRSVLAEAGAEEVLDNVVSNEEDVKGVLAKVSTGEADAGFVYATDARAAGDAVLAIELPATAQAEVRHPVAVVAGTERREAADAFVELLLGDEGRAALRAAGFGVP